MSNDRELKGDLQGREPLAQPHDCESVPLGANRDEAWQRAEELRPILMELGGMLANKAAAELNKRGILLPAAEMAWAWHEIDPWLSCPIWMRTILRPGRACLL